MRLVRVTVAQQGKRSAWTRKSKRTRAKRVAWTKEDAKELKRHSKAKTPLAAISKSMKRTPGPLRQQAFKLGMSLGHGR
jgi:hypothetical protein